MDTNDFLSAVLPTQGKYCTFVSNGELRKNIFVDTLEDLRDTNTELSERGSQTYFALASFDDSGSREAVHAQFVRSLFADLDCGFEIKNGERVQKSFVSKRAAVEALHAFLQASGLDALGSPWLVDSGGGVHVYWPLNCDTEIAEWKVVAEAFKRAAKALKFPIDMTVTSDAARVLRCPGTLNWKYEPPKQVHLRHRGSTFDLGEIAAALKPYAVTLSAPSTALMLPGARPKAAEMSAVAKAMMGNNVTYFKNIIVRTQAGTGCAQVGHYIEHAADDGMEPLWRGMLSLTKVCVDGDKAGKRLSALHPYDLDRMYSKLAEIKGPYTCATLDSTNPGVCQTCPNYGKINTPLVLGREVQMATEPVVYDEVVDDDRSVQYDRPEPPYGFSYGQNGGLYYRVLATKKDELDKDVLLLPYDFFMTCIFSDTAESTAEFKAVKAGKVYSFGIPLAKATDPTECRKELAKKNIMASHPGFDGYLALFVRQSIQNHSASGTEVAIPPRLGWQDGGDFVAGDTFYSQHGEDRDYAFKSSRLHNLSEATRCKGSLEEWRKPLELLVRKKCWGHVAIAGTGFASMLMHFMPAGSRCVVVHTCGTKSGKGKSYANTLSNSIWGEPKRFNISPETSLTTLMQRAGLLGSLPLSVDEVSNKMREADREFMPRLAFSYAAGVHKLKGSNQSNAEIENDLFWEGIMNVSSNIPAVEAMMGARNTTSEGEVRRMLEWNVDYSTPLVWAPEEEEISQLMMENYGVAGRAFAQWCVRNQEEVQKICDRVRALWIAHSGATGDERFWTAGVSANIAGYIIAHRAGIVSVPTSELMDFWLEEVIRPTRATIGANQVHAMDVLTAYIRENNSNFIHVSASILLNQAGKNYVIAPDTSPRMIRGRIEYDMPVGYENLYIEESMLKRHCAERNFSYNSFLKELASAGVLSQGRKNLTAGSKSPALRTACICITRPISGTKAIGGGP